MWDIRAGTRERLYLLTWIGRSDPSEWLYNSVSDRWSNGRIGHAVELEAEASLQLLKDRGIKEGQARALIADGLGAGVRDEEWIARWGTP